MAGVDRSSLLHLRRVIPPERRAAALSALYAASNATLAFAGGAFALSEADHELSQLHGEAPAPTGLARDKRAALFGAPLLSHDPAWLPVHYNASVLDAVVSEPAVTAAAAALAVAGFRESGCDEEPISLKIRAVPAVEVVSATHHDFAGSASHNSQVAHLMFNPCADDANAEDAFETASASLSVLAVGALCNTLMGCAAAAVSTLSLPRPHMAVILAWRLNPVPNIAAGASCEVLAGGVSVLDVSGRGLVFRRKWVDPQYLHGFLRAYHAASESDAARAKVAQRVRELLPRLSWRGAASAAATSGARQVLKLVQAGMLAAVPPIPEPSSPPQWVDTDLREGDVLLVPAETTFITWLVALVVLSVVVLDVWAIVQNNGATDTISFGSTCLCACHSHGQQRVLALSLRHRMQRHCSLARDGTELTFRDNTRRASWRPTPQAPRLGAAALGAFVARRSRAAAGTDPVTPSRFEQLLRLVVDAFQAGDDAAYCTRTAALLHADASAPAFLAAQPRSRATVCDVLDRIAADMDVLGAAAEYAGPAEAALNAAAARDDFIELEAGSDDDGR